MAFEENLKTLKVQLEKAKTDYASFTAKKDLLEASKTKCLTRLKELGFTVDEAENRISKLSDEISVLENEVLKKIREAEGEDVETPVVQTVEVGPEVEDIAAGIVEEVVEEALNEEQEVEQEEAEESVSIMDKLSSL